MNNKEFACCISELQKLVLANTQKNAQVKMGKEAQLISVLENCAAKNRRGKKASLKITKEKKGTQKV